MWSFIWAFVVLLFVTACFSWAMGALVLFVGEDRELDIILLWHRIQMDGRILSIEPVGRRPKNGETKPA
jgi:hypothetical protein